jgi:hypothetical protein
MKFLNGPNRDFPKWWRHTLEPGPAIWDAGPQSPPSGVKRTRLTDPRTSGQMFGYESGFADCLTLTIKVMSSKLNSDPRKLTGEVVFQGSHDYQSVHDVRPYHGSWIFYTADRFGAEIQLRAGQIERLWNIYSADRQGFLLAITEGPPVTELDRHLEGDFRINFWNE